MHNKQIKYIKYQRDIETNKINFVVRKIMKL